MEEHIITDRRRQISLVGIVALSILMFTLDYGMLNISLPVIAAYFGVGLVIVERLPLAYLLVVTSTMLGFGRLGDIKGFKNIFILGLVIFVTGTFLCGIARDMNTLLAFRIFQCLGEAMFSPVGIALITTCLPSGIKGSALGIVAMAQGLGFTLGPVIGSLINSSIGWHYIFFINIPVGILAIVLALKWLPKEQPKSTDNRFDVVGAVLIFTALAALIYALNSVFKLGWTSRAVDVCLIASLISLALFVFWERKIPYPILDIGLFRNRDFSFASASVFFAILVYMGFIFLFPFYLGLVRRLDIVRSGLILMVPPLLMVITAPLAGYLSDRIGSRGLCSFAMILATLAFFLAAFIDAHTGILLIIIFGALAGAAMGFFLAPNNKLVMIHAPADKQGMASGVYKIVLNTGGIFGIALLPLVLMQAVFLKTGGRHINLAELKRSPEIMMAGFHGVFVAGAVICLLAAVFSFFARDKK